MGELKASGKRAAGPAADTTIVARILDGAETVLRQYGYAGFSTRRVAEEAGIAVGNLTYHFPTKTELVRALIGRLMTLYLARFEEELRAPGRGFEALVEWLLGQSIDDQASSIFRELWAMARHDEVVRDAIDDFYDTMMARVTETLRAAHPAADPRKIDDLVQLIAIVSEGSTILYGTRRARASSHYRIVALMRRLIPAVVPELAASQTPDR